MASHSAPAEKSLRSRSHDKRSPVAVGKTRSTLGPGWHGTRGTGFRSIGCGCSAARCDLHEQWCFPVSGSARGRVFAFEDVSRKSIASWQGQRSGPPAVTDMTAAMIAATARMAPHPEWPW